MALREVHHARQESRRVGCERDDGGRHVDVENPLHLAHRGFLRRVEKNHIQGRQEPDRSDGKMKIVPRGFIHGVRPAWQAAEKALKGVILSVAKNLSS